MYEMSSRPGRMPVLVRLKGLDEAGALLRGPLVPPVQDAGLAQHPPHRRGRRGDNVGIEHHEREPAVALQRVLRVESENRLALPGLQRLVTLDERVVLVGLAVPPLPVVEFPALDADPGDEAGGGDLGPLGPSAHEVDDGVTRVGGNPTLVQGSPSAYFKVTYSSLMEAMTASFLATRALSASTSRSRSFSRELVVTAGWKAPARFSKACFCQ